MKKLKQKPNQLLESCRNTFNHIITTLEKKNGDYAGEGFGPYKNFQDLELQEYFDRKNIKLDAVELGIRIRMKDKWSRVNTLLFSDKGPSVTNESFDDTLGDAIGYYAIWVAWRQYVKNKKKQG